MGDEKIETGRGDGAGDKQPAAPARRNADENTGTAEPKVEGGQPPVGDNLPRNTEF